MIPLFGTILCAFVFWPDIDSRFIYESWIGLSFLILILTEKLWRKVHWSVSLCFGLMALSSISMFFGTGNSEYAYSLIGLLLFSIVLLIQNKKFFNALLFVLFSAAFLNSGYIIISYILFHKNYGMLNNGAGDASFIACMLPVALLKIRKNAKYFALFLISIMISAILITKSSTGIAAIGVGAAFVLLQKFSFKKWLSIMIPLALGVSTIGYLYLGSDLLDGNGRPIVFKEAWDAWKIQPWFGYGTGSYTVIGRAIQEKNHGHSVWLWLHNTYLEVMFENGIIGLMGIIAVYFCGLRNLYKSKKIEFAIAIVYLFIGLTEMPERLFVTQMLGVCLLGIAFKGNDNTQVWL